MKHDRLSKWRESLLPLGLLIALLCLAAFPVAIVVDELLAGGDITAKALRGELLDPALIDSLLRTLALALLACAAASVVALPLALQAARTGTTTRTLIQVFGLLPLAMPPFLSAAVLHHFVTGEVPASASSVAHADAYLVAAFALHYLPLLTFMLTAGIQQADRSLLASARSLGAGRIRIIWQIALPLAFPAYLLGLAVALLRMIEDVGTPLLLGLDGLLGPQLLTAVEAGDAVSPRLAALVLALGGLSLLTVILAWSALAAPVRGAHAGLRQTGWRPHRRSGSLAAFLAVLTIGTLALLPAVWLAAMALDTGPDGIVQPGDFALDHYRALTADGAQMLQRTLVFAAGGGALAALLGGAVFLAWRRRGASAHAMRFGVLALLTVPGAVLALAYRYLPLPPAAELITRAELLWAAAVIVVTLKLLPLALRIAAIQSPRRAAPTGIAAQILSLSGRAAYLRLRTRTLAGIVVALFTAGAITALAELSVPLLLFGPTDALLTLDMFTQIQNPTTRGQAAAAGTLLVGLQFLGLLLIYVRTHRDRRRRVGRTAVRPVAASESRA